MEGKEEDLEIAIPGYMTVRQASRILNVKPDRVYEYIQEGRLTKRSVSGRTFIPELEVRNFRRNAVGRARKAPPPWRVYRSGIDLLAMGILVHIYPGQQEIFHQKLNLLREQKLHQLTGTVQRFILVDEDSPSTIHIWLLWKDNEMPNEKERIREIEAFQTEFADVLDWENARESNLKGLLYT